MRLSVEEVAAIKAAAEHAFGPDAVARLFGSRAHDDLGDERVASNALLRQVEQLEDGLARTLRAVLRMLAVSLKGLYALDIGNKKVALVVCWTTLTPGSRS